MGRVGGRERDGDEEGDGLVCVCRISNNHVRFARWPVTVATLDLRLLREVASFPFSPGVGVIS